MAQFYNLKQKCNDKNNPLIIWIRNNQWIIIFIENVWLKYIPTSVITNNQRWASQ